MIEEFIDDAEQRMDTTLEALDHAMNKIRTGRAHPKILDSIMVPYYGNDTPLAQVANLSILDARTIGVTPWEKNLVGDIEKAIMKSDLGLNPSTSGAVIRIPMPPLTEETRKGFIRQARREAEQSRVSVRNIRRDVISDIKSLLKEKDITEDEERNAHEKVQKVTDRFIGAVEKVLAAKEKDLMEI
jgi:ribosome recycling factor